MFQFDLQPRLSETDSLGHINNTFVPAWFEEARRDLFRLFNPDLKARSWNIIVKKYTVDFIAPISYIEPVRIDTLIARLGGSSLTLEQRAYQEEKLVASCACTLIHFSRDTEQPQTIPDAIRATLEPHLGTFPDDPAKTRHE